MGEPGLIHQLHGPADIAGAVPAANGVQHVVLHALGVDADTGDAIAAQDGHLLSGDGVGPPGLHRALDDAAQVECLPQPPQQAVHLPRREGGGRTAAHIEGLHPQPQVPHHLRRAVDLREKGLQIRLDPVERLLHAVAHKAAVGAAGGAEGDPHIQGDFLRRKAPLGLQPRLGALDAQPPPGRGDKIRVPQDALGLPLALPLLQQPRRQLGRTDARQRPPGRGHAGQLPGRLEKAQLHNPLLQALLLVGIQPGGDLHAGDAPGGPAPHGQGGGGGVETRPGGEGHHGGVGVLAAVYRTLVREKGQQALLHGVAVVVAPKNQLHLASACRR